MLDTTGTLQQFMNGLSVAFAYWWTWLPVVLGSIAYYEYFAYQRARFITGLKWTVLEVIPPPQILFSSPKAAENFFSGLHATYAGFPGTSWKSQFFQGKVPVWFSLEIVSNGGDIHFFIRCTQDQRNVVEALLFAQYPDCEIRIVPDYIDILPAKLDLSTHDISGSELEFTKEPAYPIKTYPEFEEAGGKDEYARLDPIAPLLEIMSALQPGENLWLQYVVRATGGDWAKENQFVVDKMIGREAKVTESLIGTLITLPFKLLETVLIELGLQGPAAEEVKKKDEKQFNIQGLTPAQKVVLEQIEYKLAKLAFKCGIRLLYTAPKESFNGSRVASVTGMFKQLYFTNLNSFKPGNSTRDKGHLKWLFPSDVGIGSGPRVTRKKEVMFENYRARKFPNKAFPKSNGPELVCILTTEELATLWHMPGLNVKAPLLPRVTAKKGQPPAILPTR